ncbi:MAG: hypothetical protein PQJ46_10405 [Spirochaetales bacterium]|nr:hypothetical protein [Spirochaetales bacterium]
MSGGYGLNWYAYANNNPLKYVDPTGLEVCLVGITTTAGGGTAVTYESGIAVSHDKEGNWEVGTYQSSGAGAMGGAGVSATLSITIAPLAQEISDLSGVYETVGGSGSLAGLSLGGDVNIPLDGSKKNFSVTLNAGVAAGTTEGHGLTTTTTVSAPYATGKSFTEAWNAAMETGMLDDMPKDIIDHFSKAYTTQNNAQERQTNKTQDKKSNTQEGQAGSEDTPDTPEVDTQNNSTKTSTKTSNQTSNQTSDSEAK